MGKDITIKDAPQAGQVEGTDKVPVSNGTNAPASVTIDQIKAYVLEAISQLVAQNSGDIDRLIESKDQLGEAKAISLDTERWPTLTGLPISRTGEGAPAIIPDFIGQRYMDTTNKKAYLAFGVSSVSDWVVMN